MCVCEWVRVCVCVGTESDIRYLLLSLPTPTLFCEAESLTESSVD